MLKRLALVSATLLLLVIGLETTFAQAPTGQSSSVTQTSKADKEAISKACSEQANAQGLHGKARKKFRSKCKRTHGKAM
jgi:psiF repeat